MVPDRQGCEMLDIDKKVPGTAVLQGHSTKGWQFKGV
jgi:hypothetical protein